MTEEQIITHRNEDHRRLFFAHHMGIKIPGATKQRRE